jgi:dihydroorotate dehydrogenase
LQGAGELDALLAALKDKQQRLADLHGKLVPLALKIAPDLDDEQIKSIADTLLRHRFEGVIATNTTLSRAAVTGLPHADETGGLSGKPVFDASNEVIRKLRAEVGDTVPIIGVGGISGEDARAKLAAGAALVQLYTGFIYRGPALVAECAQALA